LSKKGQGKYGWLQRKRERLLSRMSKDPVILTDSKVQVRSKPEKRIADHLFKRGFLFRYEKKLILNGQTFYPDFYLPDFDIYIEYFGLRQIPSYRDKSREKIKIYAQNDIDCIYLYHRGSRHLEWILDKELKKRNRH